MTANINQLPSRKYRVAPEEVEKKSRTSEEYKLTYDFKRLKKVDKDSERYARCERKTDGKIERKHLEALCPWEKLFLFCIQGQKKDALSIFYKNTIENF